MYRIEPARFVRGSEGQPVYTRFVGPRPKSECASPGRSRSRSTCEARVHPECVFYVDNSGRRVCRNRFPGSVSRRVPPGSSARFVPPSYPSGFTPCQRHLTPNECYDSPNEQCQWHSDPYSSFCKGPWGTAVPAAAVAAARNTQPGGRYWWPQGVPSTAYVAGVTPSVSFNPKSISQQSKQQWYYADAPLDDLQRKYCRCLLENEAQSVYQHKQVATVPYAICNSRLPASIARQTGINERELRSAFARTSQSGACTVFANFDAMPTPMLYGYAVEHSQGGGGQQFFPNLDDLVPYAEFTANPEAFRPLLLDMLHEYQHKEEPRVST